ncbi:MAG TPA: hypothetical protein VMZ29_03295, partial [Candidatus Bathyarchaeia archaeon]|nr:hypothetical protein [Candidatus Bathyarchaeia archaeon]
QTNAEVLFREIESYEFLKEQRSDEKALACYEDYFKCTTHAGYRYKIILNCWKTPQGTNSTEYLESVIQYYLDQAQRSIFAVQKAYQDISEVKPISTTTPSEIPYKITETKPLAGYSFSVRKEITDEMVAEVGNLIKNVNQVSISWLQSVTRYPVFIIEEIVTIYLGYKIKNDFVIK